MISSDPRQTIIGLGRKVALVGLHPLSPWLLTSRSRELRALTRRKSFTERLSPWGGWRVCHIRRKEVYRKQRLLLLQLRLQRLQLQRPLPPPRLFSIPRCTGLTRCRVASSPRSIRPNTDILPTAQKSSRPHIIQSKGLQPPRSRRLLTNPQLVRPRTLLNMGLRKQITRTIQLLKLQQRKQLPSGRCRRNGESSIALWFQKPQGVHGRNGIRRPRTPS
mmetsp:Transcript_42691/g.66876  ORF Transcript_42691/g.66876 Transcript_42691/m.66876 type:complete len:219 (+) Transcript_42691:181-837(+)